MIEPGTGAADPLDDLLAAGELAALHGRPDDAVDPLERAVLLAREVDRVAEACAAGWLLGVALAAAGRWGSALLVLAPLVDAGGATGADATRRLFGALAGTAAASVHRQLGEHAVARTLDLAAHDLGTDSREARIEALLGLAADEVGLDDAAAAQARLAQVAELLAGSPPGGAEDPWWRQRVESRTTEAEVALQRGDAIVAAALARDAAAAARGAGAPRLAAKALLVQALAELDGTGRADLRDGAPDPVVTLTAAVALAEQVAARPLVWPTRALLGALQLGSSPEESARSLSAARDVVRELAADLAPAARERWLARPEVAALLTR